MICLQPSWITTLPPRRFLTEHCRSQSLGSLEHLKIAEADLNTPIPPASADQSANFDTTKIYHLLHLRKSDMFHLSFPSRTSKKLKNIENPCTRSNSDISRKVKTLDGHHRNTVNDTALNNNFFNNSSTKQQRIKKVIKWIQRNGQRASSKYKGLKNSSFSNKKQETAKPVHCKCLHDVFRAKETTRAFHEFLLKEMSAENLDFYLQVENYKQQAPAKQKKMAAVIFQTFIAPGSLKEVNLDSSIRKETKENLLSPDSTSFDIAQAQIFTLMENDSFRRFTKLMC